ncbi:MAG: enoyl-CoA hydratase-related protein [Vampirovibrionales bacterium]|nr:enoyl-CoA hydratase-related protein [Vampirovibrionales bacterium]
MTPDMAAPLVLTSHMQPHVTLLTLHRPEVLNALNLALMRQLADHLRILAQDETCRVVILTGSGEKAFAAGADISEMHQLRPEVGGKDDFLAVWDVVANFPKPIIAAVNGYALGGGCELAMMADMTIACENAVFGQPECLIGVIPGAGGTQRLLKCVGKSLAMDMILTGRRLSAADALQAGLISRVVPQEQLLEQARNMAESIAKLSPRVAQLAKQMLNMALETPLSEGLKQERQAFYRLFGTPEQQEGMAAFLNRKK